MDDKTLVVTAPPPPSEVKIRTMRSDLESMRKSGGGAPKFQNVSVSGLSMDKIQSQPVAAPMREVPAQQRVQPSSNPEPIPDAVSVTPSSGNSNGHLVGILIVIVVAILAIGGVGYFAYVTFVK